MPTKDASSGTDWEPASVETLGELPHRLQFREDFFDYFDRLDEMLKRERDPGALDRTSDLFPAGLRKRSGSSTSSSLAELQDKSSPPVVEVDTPSTPYTPPTFLAPSSPVIPETNTVDPTSLTMAPLAQLPPASSRTPIRRLNTKSRKRQAEEEPPRRDTARQKKQRLSPPAAGKEDTDRMRLRARVMEAVAGKNRNPGAAAEYEAFGPYGPEMRGKILTAIASGDLDTVAQRENLNRTRRDDRQRDTRRRGDGQGLV